MIQSTDFQEEGSKIGLLLQPDDIHIMKKSEYSGMFGDYTTFSDEMDEDILASQRRRRKKRMRSKTASIPYGIWMAIFIVVPMILVVIFAFTDKSGRFTLENIAAVGQYSNVFLRSIWLGAIATGICLLVGYPLAYIISRTGARVQSVLVMLVMLPMWMNFLLRTYAWMTLLEDNGIINTALGHAGIAKAAYDQYVTARWCWAWSITISPI